MITFLILLVTFIVTAYMYATRHFHYWKNRGIFYIKPVPFVGNLGSIFLAKYNIGDYLHDIYRKHRNEKFVGIFLADKPCLVVNDFDLISRIFKQDFQYFSNRILTFSKKTDPLVQRSLFALYGLEWKNTRALLSPVFAAKKQKSIFGALLGVGNKFEDFINRNSTIELKSLSSRYTTDGISDAVLCMEGKAILDPENDKVKAMGDRMFEESYRQGLRLNLAFLAPELQQALGIPLFPSWIYQMMSDLVRKAVQRHEELGLNTNYIGGLLELRKKGSWQGNNGEVIIPDDDNLVGQLFMFFTAGFETAASGVTFCLYEAAANPDIQDRLREEMWDMIDGHDGVLDFDSVNDMIYLNKFIKECLRKYPAFPFVDRICTMDYQIPGTKVVLEKGTRILVPMQAFHRDEKYFEDPMKIIPERFDDPEIENEKPYFPFGMGPRICLGMRFALLGLKIAMISALKNHRLTVNSKTKPIVMSSMRFGSTPKNEIYLDVEPLKRS